jgi:hypothetical protein
MIYNSLSPSEALRTKPEAILEITGIFILAYSLIVTGQIILDFTILSRENQLLLGFDFTAVLLLVTIPNGTTLPIWVSIAVILVVACLIAQFLKMAGLTDMQWFFIYRVGEIGGFALPLIIVMSGGGIEIADVLIFSLVCGLFAVTVNELIGGLTPSATDD